MSGLQGYEGAGEQGEKILPCPCGIVCFLVGSSLHPQTIEGWRIMGIS